MRKRGGLAILASVLALTGAAHARAEDETPFIDSIKSQLPPAEEGPSYTDGIRSKLGAESPNQGDTSGESLSPYIDQLKTTQGLSTDSTSGYTDREKERLGAPKDGGAIQAVTEGHSDLHPIYEGKVTSTFGMRYGLAMSRNFTANGDSLANDFNTVYGANPSPELQIYAERQLVRLEGGASIGLAGSVGIGYFSGMGIFGANLRKPWDPTQSFGLNSSTFFQFWEFPVMVGASARIALLKYLQPYVIAGPTVVGYMETRNDPVQGVHGFSTGLQGTLGVAIQMDWLTPGQRWEAYQSSGVKHGYLTVEYTMLQPLTGDVSFNTSALSAGFALEF